MWCKDSVSGGDDKFIYDVRGRQEQSEIYFVFRRTVFRFYHQFLFILRYQVRKEGGCEWVHSRSQRVLITMGQPSGAFVPWEWVCDRFFAPQGSVDFSIYQNVPHVEPEVHSNTRTHRFTHNRHNHAQSDRKKHIQRSHTIKRCKCERGRLSSACECVRYKIAIGGHFRYSHTARCKACNLWHPISRRYKCRLITHWRKRTD